MALIGYGAVHTVDILVDEDDGNTSAGDLSLREAIKIAATGDTIAFSVSGTIVLASQLEIDKDLTIVGPGAEPLTVSGNDTYNVFIIQTPSLTVAISDLTIAHGYSSTSGAGIYNAGTLTLTDCLVTENHGAWRGAGVANAGTMTMQHCTIRNNSAAAGDGSGGGLLNGGVATLENCTVEGNTAATSGGGILNEAILTLINCTVSGNTASGIYGGGVANGDKGQATLESCTVSDNDADTGGGIYCDLSGTVNVKNTLIADNTATTTGPDCSGNLESYGYNLIKNATGWTISGDATGNLIGLDPKLGPLADNGGLTFTHALLSDSPAIDAIPPPYNNAPPTDQRGVARPQPAGGYCDIGAVEMALAYANGDVNGDGVIDLLDVRLCLQIAQGYVTGTPQQRAAADGDGDGDVDADDVTILSEYVLGIRSTLP